MMGHASTRRRCRDSDTPTPGPKPSPNPMRAGTTRAPSGRAHHQVPPEPPATELMPQVRICARPNPNPNPLPTPFVISGLDHTVS